MKNRLVLSRELTVLRDAFGPTILEALADTHVVEVMVNTDGKIWVDKIGQGRLDTGAVLDFAKRDTILKMVAHHTGEMITRDNPQLSAVLPDTGERFQGLCSPIVSSPSFTIRKRPEIIFTLEDYIEQGSLTRERAGQLTQAVTDKKNILVVGGTGSGKTTFVNALLALPTFTNERVVIIEDTPELQCSAADKMELLTKRTEPKVTMRDLVMTTLRLRPDRIIVGEVRDGSALDMLKAWNTGHPG
ncbi:MAG: ATPase, T2SS/T4P/T4SS family, partial [Alphaproteobacteria bacterium]